jgi:drug/metabolite transporter (DMT)-like permease
MQDEPRHGRRGTAFAAAAAPVAALVFNALVWGTSWWPMRQLAEHGLHPLWATSAVFAVVVAGVLALRPSAFGVVLRTPALWVLLLAAGITNSTFNWGVVVGDVVRVVLLFYLMPLWAVLLARLVLGEKITPFAVARLVLALAGAMVVLWPVGSGIGGVPLPRSLGDWLGVFGGVSFALNNVMLKRQAASPSEGIALAMFAGGALVPGLLAGVLAATGSVPWPAPAGWLPFALMPAMALLYFVGNLALQYGAVRLPANVSSVVMITEVVFATGSALLLGGGQATPALLLGGGLIVAAALLSALGPRAET